MLISAVRGPIGDKNFQVNVSNIFIRESPHSSDIARLARRWRVGAIDKITSDSCGSALSLCAFVFGALYAATHRTRIEDGSTSRHNVEPSHSTGH